MPKLLPLKAYKTIIRYSPVVSNDILVEAGGKYLLGRRINQPGRGLWWTPGGRVKKNEKLIDAVHRIMKEELGIKKIKIEKFLGVFEFFWKPGKFGQKDIHYVSFGFVVKPVGAFKIKLDSQHSEYRFFKNPPRGSHAFFKKMFSLARNKKYKAVKPYSFHYSGK